MRFFKKQIFILTTIFTLLASYVLPYINHASAAENYITVAEAIAQQNSGTKTVKGYIVGITNNGPNYQTTPPFTVNTNLAIADSLTEKDKVKILPVQLPNNELRTNYNLKDHPEYLGKEVYITGSLEAYFAVPGIKNLTAISFDAPGGGPVDPPVDPPADGIKISAIQGESHDSPYKGQNVKGVEGVVTFVKDASNFYIQDPNPDNNAKTSEGILVYQKNHTVKIGDLVSVDALVKEWVLEGYSDMLQTDLATTELDANAGKVTVKASGQELPKALVIGKDIHPPTQIVDNDMFAKFDPEEDGIDFYESIEGMRVAIENPVAVAPQRYGEVPVIAEKVDGKVYTTPGGIPITKDNMNPERLPLLFTEKDETYKVKTGDKYDGTVTGVITYTFQNYKLLTNKADLPALVESDYTQEVTDLVKDDEKLTVASYNMENYTKTDTAKTAKIAESIVKNLKTPDIVGLVEVQDNNGETAGGTAADQNYQALIDAIKVKGGPTYKWTDIEPVNNQDGGAPNGNIRVGFIYNPDRVSLKTGAAKGGSTQAVGYENGSLTLNPGRIDPTNTAFSSSRKPLAAEFIFNGEDVIVIANHFNSKGGDQPIFGKNQPPVLGSEAKRVEIAGIVNNFIQDVKSKNEDAKVVVLGDLNDFEFSNPLTKLKGNELTNLIEKVPAPERFTYSYQGNSQVLDHMLVSNNLADRSEIDIVHLNSPFTPAHGRVSDHDAVLAQINLKSVPTSPEHKAIDLTVMHTNDSHAQVEKFPKLATAVKEVRGQKKNTLLLNAGDVFSGTLYFNKYEGQADLWFMNKIGFDAMTFGNHEFDKDSKTLGNFVKNLAFPVVSANVNVTKDPILGPLFKNEISYNPEGGKIYPAIVKEIDGEKVGIFGLTTEETVFLSSPALEIEFENSVEKSKATVAALQKEGINKIIAVTHLGVGPEQELAKAVDGIDIIVGGHSHTKLVAPIVVDKAEPTIVVQANEYNNYLGMLDVSFDDKGVVTFKDGKLLDISTYAEDEEAKAKVEEFKGPLEEIKKVVVGSSTVDLDGARDNVRSKETNLGNLITDGMLEKAKSLDPKTTIALQNGGGIRAPIAKGDVTLGDVFTVLPFGNLLVTMDLTGQEIWDALEHSVSKVESKEGRFLQAAGLQYKYAPAKPAYDRVWEVNVKTANGYEPIDLKKMYTVATNAFTADGGDGFTGLKKAKDEGRINELMITDYEIMKEYFEKHSPVAPAVEGRIIAKAASFNLSLMHVNDTHANVEQYPKLTTAVNKVRAEKPNALLVDAGDVFSGTLYFNQYLGKADLWFMNKLKYDAMTFGNHEFDKDSATLAGFMSEMTFPMVSANVNVTKDPVLGPLFKNEISATPEGGKIYSAIVKTINGEKVGIFGLTTEDTTFLANPSKQIVFENAVEKAKTTVAALKEQGINKIVVLSHLGYGPDQELAKAVDGIDVIVGGHSHTKLDQPVVIEKAEPTVIVQANEYLKYLGTLDVTFDENGVVTKESGKLLDVNTYAPDSEAQAKVDELKKPLEELKKQVVGSSSVLLDGERNNVRYKETNLGNLIADGMAQKANEILKNNTTIAMQNGGGIRASIQKGDVTLGDIYTVLPFANLLVTLDLTGEEIWQALEHSVSKVESGAGQFMQVSGLQFKYDPKKDPYKRVWEVKVKTADGYEPINLTKTYSVATNAFAADGGDGFTMFKEAKDAGRIHELLLVDYEILTESFAKNSPVSPAVEGRILTGEQPQVQNGWVQDGSTWYYYENGKKHIGWLELESKKYYFSQDGAMLTGWILVDGNWYNLGADGVMQTGLVTIDGKKFYLGTDGALQTGLITIEGKNYFFGPDGSMKTGWIYSASKWYYFGSDGAMKTGLVELNGKKYYLGNDGVMQTGVITIEGITYYFNLSGAMETGFVEIEGNVYFFDETDGMITGFAEIDGDVYFFDEDGIMITGWVTIDTDLYYFDEDGVMAVGFNKIDGDLYYFDEDGIYPIGWIHLNNKWYFQDYYEGIVTGWINDQGKWYFMNTTGVMQTGWVKDLGKWYFLDSSGAMKIGWVKDQGKWYFLDSSGAMKIGWVKDQGKWYFLDSSGAMKTGWVLDQKKWYFLDASGAMKTGWAQVNGSWYFMNTSGAMQTGWLFVGGKWYYLYTNGKMAANTKIQGYKLGADGAWRK
ncbi:5'-nucleotidase C-terminal domain-containing protein [Neobacillus sp. NPDC097160]|uniref:5'-nucleotidase C-terminal domain-containing protein n=1 Tax=Neobacillus sp. NPDC097160 TaxID=3364298 RepID=UPI003802F275